MRYAIYYTPPADDPLTRRAAQWLGRDAFTGEGLAQPIVEAFSEAAFADLTADPRRYAFHATLKAPFELAGNRAEDELLAAFEDFAAATPAFTLPQLVVGQLGRFFALVPAAPNAELQMLADDCVSRFDVFRAALDERDIARRNPERLSPPQRQNLLDWGYPYVFEEFRFHMTLTAQVDPEDQPAMRAAIDSWFAGLVPAPRPVEHLALFVEPARGVPFTLRHIVQLSDTARRKIA
jgi:putative phosphonate metabolism protein